MEGAERDGGAYHKIHRVEATNPERIVNLAERQLVKNMLPKLTGVFQARKQRSSDKELIFELHRWRQLAVGTRKAQRRGERSSKTTRAGRSKLRKTNYIRNRAAKQILAVFRALIWRKRFAKWVTHGRHLKLAGSTIYAAIKAWNWRRRYNVWIKTWQRRKLATEDIPRMENDLLKKLGDIVQNEAGFRQTNKGGGLILYSYEKSNDKIFRQRKNETAEAAMLRRELRSLVLSKDSKKVVARALPKFMLPGKEKGTNALIVNEATVKLDGAMVFGIPSTNQKKCIELWTKGGSTEISRKAQDFAVREEAAAGGAMYEECIAWCVTEGVTPTLEFTGRHHAFGRIGTVAGTAEELTLVAAREMVSGRFLCHDELLEIAGRFHLPVIARRPDLEGKTLMEVKAIVKKEEGYEGVVVSVLGSGQRYKMKTDWWLKKQALGASRVEGMGKKEEERGSNPELAGVSSWAIERSIRYAHKEKKLTLRSQRVVWQGLPHDISPAKLLEEPGVVKVESFYNRVTGVRGAIVASFKDPNLACKCLVRSNCVSEIWKSPGLGQRKQAYSGRSSGSTNLRVQTWWRNEHGNVLVGKQQQAGRAKAGQGIPFSTLKWRMFVSEFTKAGTTRTVEPGGVANKMNTVIQEWAHKLGWQYVQLHEKVSDIIGRDVITDWLVCNDMWRAEIEGTNY